MILQFHKTAASFLDSFLACVILTQPAALSCCIYIFSNLLTTELSVINLISTIKYMCFIIIAFFSIKEESLTYTLNTLATWCKELTHWKRPWCWERLKAGGEGDDRGWDSWKASPTRWIRVWASSRSWWWTGKPGMLQSMGSQKVGHDWGTELIDSVLFYLSPTSECSSITS